jgi:hypothetical protein
MRITDSRYDRDRLRLALAYRMIRLGARTHTIRQATQLSDDRIRRMYRDYFPSRGTDRLRRPRGKSPRQMAFYRRSLDHEQQTALLGSLIRRCGLEQPYPNGFRPNLEDANSFCDAYETYAGLCPAPPHITFEHAWHLWQVLCCSDEYEFGPCQDCSALWLRDTLEILPDNCPTCRRGLFK